MSELKCEELVHDGGSWPRYHPCGRKATSGKYCKIHDPVERKAKADKRAVIHAAKYQKQRAHSTCMFISQASASELDSVETMIADRRNTLNSERAKP